MKKTATIKLKCLICNIEEKVKIPVQSRGQLFFVEVPPRYCGVCFTILDQIIDGAEKQKEGDNEIK